LTGFDQASYKKAVEEIDKILTQNKMELQQKINEIAKKYRSFKIADDIYTEIYKAN
jgi:hypothetical protein